jgi:hypothetical protein
MQCAKQRPDHAPDRVGVAAHADGVNQAPFRLVPSARDNTGTGRAAVSGQQRATPCGNKSQLMFN